MQNFGIQIKLITAQQSVKSNENVVVLELFSNIQYTSPYTLWFSEEILEAKKKQRLKKETPPLAEKY